MYHLNILIHILSAIIWVGGIFFLALVVVPVARRLPATERAAMVTAVASQFRPLGWICLVLLVITGVFNLAFRGITWNSFWSGAILETLAGQLIVAKLILIAVMVVVSAIHDFIVGPASTRAHAAAGAQPTAAMQAEINALRRRAAWLARVTGLLALMIVILAVAVVRGLPW